jgi:mRNA-degrading endonuclease RelE of RelBE toxin-antitoxin system
MFAMSYAVYTLEQFDKKIEDLPASDLEIIEKIFQQLKENLYVGDQIRYKFFREKRIREKRMYYLIYEGLSAVLVVAFGGKKVQQDIIDEIIAYFPEYKKYIENLLRNNKN